MDRSLSGGLFTTRTEAPRVLSTSGDALASDKVAAWAEVYDELRSHQSLASVINDPRRGTRVTRGEVASVEDLWDAVREGVEELTGANDADLLDERAEAQASARTDELVGPVPSPAEIQPYLDTFHEHAEAYFGNHRGSLAKNGSSLAVDGDVGSHAYRTVPPEYFQTDFKLENHHIFKQSLQTSIEKQEEFNAELTGYLDRVELSLCEHIGRAEREQLFDSLARMGEPLQTDLESTLSVVKSLRGRTRSVRRAQLNHGLTVGRLARRKRHVAEVLQRLDYLSHVQESQPSIQMLLQGGDYITALDLLESTTKALDSHLKGLVSVRPAAKSIEAMASTFDRGVEADFVHHSTEAIFCTYSGGTASRSKEEAERQEKVAQLQRDLEGIRAEKLAAAKAEDFEAAGAVKRREGAALARLKELQERAKAPLELPGAPRLQRLCECLARRGLLKATLSATLRDILLSQLKKLLRSRTQSVLKELGHEAESRKRASENPEELDGEAGAAADGQPPPPPEGAPAGSLEAPPALAGAQLDGAGASASLTTALCALGFDGFLSLWRRLLRDAVDVAEHLGEFVALVHSAGSPLAAEPGLAGELAAGPRPEADLALELLRLFEVAMDSLLKKTGALLQAWQGEHKNLQVPDWQSLLTVTNESLDKVKGLQEQCRQRLCPTESYTGTDVRAGVRSILYAQTKAIVQECHQKHIERMTLTVEQEQWTRTDVPAPYKSILEQLQGRERPSETVSADQTGVESYLQVDGARFFVVPAALTLLQLLNEYVRLCWAFDSLAAEIVQRLCIMLRLFNQKTFEAILRGQAVTKGAMHKITASNIALCSQCCGLVAQVLPGLQANLLAISDRSEGASASAGQRAAVTALVGDLTKVATEYNDHRTALFSKLSDLLRERYDVHSKRWLSSPHPEAAGDEKDPLGLKPHDSLEGLVKDITSMYRVLLKNLTSDVVRKIFAKAFEEMSNKFAQRLGQELAAPQPPYESGLGRTLGDRLAIDVAYLQDQLDKLSGISTPLRALLADFVKHLREKLPAEAEPLKALHTSALEALQNSGRLLR